MRYTFQHHYPTMESFDSLSELVLLVFINGFPKPELCSS
ncbi:hypothetical protein PanWU01x14_034700 [Parasponia andersonii]|uniref:Uncharacterized protein n=1 Tax=Parasponia andersonii TaxID=3476 RepID=A0A2P5DT04_PARAD|nr:hypothetical protein PanWU01x14_034700 [Parasponia andersonii]